MLLAYFVEKLGLRDVLNELVSLVDARKAGELEQLSAFVPLAELLRLHRDG